MSSSTAPFGSGPTQPIHLKPPSCSLSIENCYIEARLVLDGRQRLSIWGTCNRKQLQLSAFRAARRPRFAAWLGFPPPRSSWLARLPGRQEIEDLSRPNTQNTDAKFSAAPWSVAFRLFTGPTKRGLSGASRTLEKARIGGLHVVQPETGAARPSQIECTPRGELGASGLLFLVGLPCSYGTHCSAFLVCGIHNACK